MSRVRRARRAIGQLADVRRAAQQVYAAPSTPVIARALRLRRRTGIGLGESLREGLLDPRLRPDPGVAPYRDRIRLQAALNASGGAGLADDRAVFAMFAHAAGLRVPRLRAVLVRDGLGWSPESDLPVAPHEWVAVLGRLRGDLVVRPNAGVRPPWPALRVDGRWRLGGAAEVAPADLAAVLAGERACPVWVVQDRLPDHRDLAALGGPDALRSVQVVTLVQGDGSVALLRAWLRVSEPGGHDALVATVDLDRGRVLDVRVPGRGGLGLRPAPLQHPGRALVGRVLPAWEDVRALAGGTAGALLPLRTLGVRVAVTPDGPVLREVDPFWTPPPGEAVRPLLERMRAA